ncbi:S-methyl-5-thioribose-1-phosphate isomerase [Gammaproteobacteria bacterium]|jgi:methylthioribose-1-phosphate isomerase|nr:S-methyl-5-thioribose-1-phosphate isomerase [Pseudomonadota bacterium]MDB0063814.1 S-methyl-5-thioribose-1-phosphate isomerase [Gammaproteobacteria bacterium]
MQPSLPNRAIEWREQCLFLLDQRHLPLTVDFLQLKTPQEAFVAIKEMVVRGAPAIGITAAYAVVLSAQQHSLSNTTDSELPSVKTLIAADIDYLTLARPTAVNLAWALARMRQVLDECTATDVAGLCLALEQAAMQMQQADVIANRRMGELGAAYIEKGSAVMTHCNAGALATAGYGTALGVIRAAHAQGKLSCVFANETRPWFQGARLTAWELQQEGITTQLLADSAAASAMQQKAIEWVIVGADRVAANGDVANKIGTYALAVLARYHGKKFMVVAPDSTIDMATSSGADIEIEERAASELTELNGTAFAAPGAAAWNPVFDVTPADLVDVLVTNRGVIEAPNRAKIKALMA